MGSGLILLVIVGAWLAVLVPMGLRSHDSAVSSRAPERFGDAMRVLSRRSALPSGWSDDDDLLEDPGDEPGRRRLLPALRSPLPALRGALTAASPAARRRRTLVGLLGLAVLTLVAGLVGPTALLGVSALAAGLAALFAASCRRAAVARQRARYEADLAAARDEALRQAELAEQEELAERERAARLEREAAAAYRDALARAAAAARAEAEVEPVRGRRRRAVAAGPGAAADLRGQGRRPGRAEPGPAGSAACRRGPRSGCPTTPARRPGTTRSASAGGPWPAGRVLSGLGAVAQSGSAPRSHRGGQGFESPQLHPARPPLRPGGVVVAALLGHPPPRPRPPQPPPNFSPAAQTQLGNHIRSCHCDSGIVTAASTG